MHFTDKSNLIKYLPHFVHLISNRKTSSNGNCSAIYIEQIFAFKTEKEEITFKQYVPWLYTNNKEIDTFFFWGNLQHFLSALKIPQQENFIKVAATYFVLEQIKVFV